MMSQESWWKRNTGAIPAWGWLLIGVVALVVVGALTESMRPETYYEQQVRELRQERGEDASAPSEPVRRGFSREGRGDDVFDAPSGRHRARVTARVVSGRGGNFAVRDGSGRHPINEILHKYGSGSDYSDNYSGMVVLTGGAIEVKAAQGITWSIVVQ